MKKVFLPILIVLLLLLTACSGRGEAPEDYIGIEAAKQAALTDAGLPANTPADFSSAGLDRADGQDFYAVEFTANGASYQYQIHPVTGEVLRANSQGPRLIGEEAACQIALQHAGLTADQVTFLPTEQEIEDGRQIYDVEFYTADYKEYDYDIDALTGEIVSFDQEAEHPLPASGTAPDAGELVSMEEAKTAALQRAGLSEQDAVFTQAELKQEYSQTIYDLEFRTADGAEYDCDIAACTGWIIKFECDLEHTALPFDTTGAVISGEEIPAALEKCEAIALSHAGLTRDQVNFRGMEHSTLDWDDGRQICEVRFDVNNHEISYCYEIDAQTGAIVKYRVTTLPLSDTPPSSDASGASAAGPVTADEAKAIALGKVPGAAAANITDFEGDYDDGHMKFEIEIKYNGMEYEFEIDSTNGAILKMESEPID